MKASVFAYLVALIVGFTASKGYSAPIALGLSNKHPLSEPEVGNLLLGELRCAACHGRKGAEAPLERTAPNLSDVGSRVAPDFLQRFIEAPAASHAGSTMPDLLAGETEDARKKIAEAITHFLIAQSPRKFQRDTIEAKETTAGKTLFHSVGCVACHSPRDESGKEEIRAGVVELSHVPVKYSTASLGEFLFQPAHVRASGRMPDMKLTTAEAKSIASYLLGRAEVKSPALEPHVEQVALGKKYFLQFNCASCHPLGEVPVKPLGIDLQSANTSKGCLDPAATTSPRFYLSDEQSKAIRTALAKPPEPISDKTRLATTLTAFNCIACHTRDNYGGVSEERNEHFQTTAKNLGDDGRIPPPLTLTGAKLQPIWMKKVLFDAESIRPYMLTRMPQYGASNVGHLPELFSRLDKVEKSEFSLPNSESPNAQDRARAKEMREAGRELMGDKGLYCIACHSFNGVTSANPGIEIMTSFQRLQPSWYYRFMLNPGAYRPRIVMPNSWPEGKAAQTIILKGDTDRQIEAIWYFLSLGTSAPTPSGIQATETKLAVTDAARTYRGRSSVAGYRGIAVGFPEKLNYAFNAETGTLSAIWDGEYVKVNRSGQGSGSFNPAGKFTQLAQDVSFFALPDEKTAWPLRPAMSKEAPVNPDPLYPKNRGYQFKGYFMDDDSIPTFMYRTGDIEIEDRSTAGTGENKGRLIRILTIKSPTEQTIWFRALTGKIEAESKRSFKSPELRLGIPTSHTLLRPTPANPKLSELLLKLEIPKGESKQTFTYELLK